MIVFVLTSSEHHEHMILHLKLENKRGSRSQKGRSCIDRTTLTRYTPSNCMASIVGRAVLSCAFPDGKGSKESLLSTTSQKYEWCTSATPAQSRMHHILRMNRAVYLRVSDLLLFAVRFFSESLCSFAFACGFVRFAQSFIYSCEIFAKFGIVLIKSDGCLK